MSLANRLHYKIRPSTTSDQIAATSRDSLLLFLYPRWFSVAIANGAGAHYSTATTSKEHAHDNEVQQTLGSQSTKTYSRSQTPQSSTHHDTSAMLNPSSSYSKEHALPNPSINASGKHEPMLCETERAGLKVTMKDRGGEREGKCPETPCEKPFRGARHLLLPETFQLAPAQISIMTNRTKATTNSRTHNLNTNSMINSKGSWSYDWRVPLLKLKQHFEPDQSPIMPSSEVARAITRYHEHRAIDIPRPSEWSQENLAFYVKELALSKVSRIMHRQLYGQEITHVFAVREILLPLFESSSMRPYLTPLAFENAMAFFYRHNMIHSCRKLFNLMTTLEIPTFPSTFNLMLRAAAEKKDLHNFIYLLRGMIQSGVKPNENTWVAFLVAVSSLAVKVAVVKQMRELRLLEQVEILQAVVNELLPAEIISHVESGHDLHHLVEYLDSNYGEKWLSTMSGNIVCRKMGELGQMSEVVKMLEIMLERNYRPDGSTLRILLTHCMKITDGDLALRFLAIFQNRYNIYPDESDYQQLFMLGWRSRRYNMCRVVWRVACVEAAVSYRMQELVMRSLFRNTPPSPCKPQDQWMKEAGKVIIGVAQQRQDRLRKGRLIDTTDKTKAIIELATYAERSEERAHQIILAKKLLATDLTASSRYRMNESFLNLLAYALKMDDKWQREGKWQMSVQKKLQKAIRTSIEPKITRVRTSLERRGKVFWSRST